MTSPEPVSGLELTAAASVFNVLLTRVPEGFDSDIEDLPDVIRALVAVHLNLMQMTNTLIGVLTALRPDLLETLGVQGADEHAGGQKGADPGLVLDLDRYRHRGGN